MKTVFSKLLLLVLALCMIVSSIAILASCSGDDKQNDTSGGEALDTGDILTDLPDKKFNEDFMIVCYDSGGEFMRETAEGDRVDYAIYMRNKAIEAKYGIEIKNKSMVYDQVPAWVSDILKANDDKSLDVVNNQSVYSSTIVLAGNALDMQTIPYIDFSKDWWLDSTLEDRDQLRIRGIWRNSSDFTLIFKSLAAFAARDFFRFFEKSLAKNSPLPLF